MPITELRLRIRAKDVTELPGCYIPTLDWNLGEFFRKQCPDFCRAPNNWFSVIRRYCPLGGRWILRNLTKREYVYAYVLASKAGNGVDGVDHPLACHELGFDLGTLIAVRTMWSSVGDWMMPQLDFPGKWAGNCFDIVTEARFLNDWDIEKSGGHKKVEDPWKDVSHEAWQELVRYYADPERNF